MNTTGDREQGLDANPAPKTNLAGAKDEQVPISREKLVLWMANTDGGSHVDPAVDRVYARLTRQSSIGWTVVYQGIERPLLGLEHASVRQVAWELLDSVQHRRALQATTPKADPASRNSPCPCGSGKRYKKCHGRAA